MQSFCDTNHSLAVAIWEVIFAVQEELFDRVVLHMCVLDNLGKN